MDWRYRLARAISKPLSLFAPSLVLGYLRHQAALSAVYGYDAARRDGPNGKWRPRDGRADDLILRDARLIRARARAMVRDNANLSGALQKIANNVVFTGIRPQAQWRGKDGKRDRKLNDTVEADFARWSRRVELSDMTRLAIFHLWQDGGFFVHFFPEKTFRDVPSLGVELLDMDALDLSVNGPQAGGAMARNGMEFDAHGRIVAYHLWQDALFGGARALPFERDPASRPLAGFGKSVRIPADECRLVMRRERIGQTLPVSWLHAVLMVTHDLDEYQSAERIAARLAAAFAVFLKQLADALITGGATNLDGSPRAPLAGGSTSDGVSMDHFISQGRIEVLPPGYDITVAENNRPGSNYEPYTRSNLRAASGGAGMSYEAYSNDYSGASYSSVRQAVLEERRGYQVQQHFLIDKFLFPVWEKFGGWRNAFGFGRETSVPVDWQTPGWSWVDPAKDAAAAVDRVNLGIVTRRQLCAEQGRDFDDVLAGLAEEKQLMEEAGIWQPTTAASNPKEEEDNAPQN